METEKLLGKYTKEFGKEKNTITNVTENGNSKSGKGIEAPLYIK